MLERAKQQGNLPHLIFHGPAGTGKTSTALAFARDAFGPNLFKSRLLELNASDERGIDVIRYRIKTWSQLTLAHNLRLSQMFDGVLTTIDDQASEQVENAPPWKIVLLDEADMMTFDAQSALRRVMEDCAEHTRFIIVCNLLGKIIQPIASRCQKCRFASIPADAQRARLRTVAEAEHLTIDSEACDEIIRIAEGDLRLAINFMQSAALGGINIITSSEIIAIAGHPPTSVATNLLTLCKNKKSESELTKYISTIIGDGWNVNVILKQLCDAVVNDDNITDICKAMIVNNLRESYCWLSDGASEHLQLLCVGHEMHTILK